MKKIQGPQPGAKAFCLRIASHLSASDAVGWEERKNSCLEQGWMGGVWKQVDLGGVRGFVDRKVRSLRRFV